MIELKVTAEQPSEIYAQLAELFPTLGATAGASPSESTTPTPSISSASSAETAVESTTLRERGKPAPGSGRSRRTKEEIAEDEAAERAEFAPEARRLAEEGAKQFEEDRRAAEEQPAESAEPDAPAMSRDEIRTAIVAEAAKLDQSERGAFVQKLLNPFGVTKLGDLPDDKLGALADAIGKLKSDVDSALA